MADRNGIPDPDHKKLRNNVGKVLGYRFSEILNYLVEELSKQAESGVVRNNAILLGLDNLFQGLDEEIRDEVIKAVEESFIDGQSYLYRSIEEAKDDAEARELATFTQLQRETINSIFEDTFNDLLMATTFTHENLKKVVRETTQDVLTYHSVRSSDMRSRYKDLESRLTKQGLNDRIKSEGFVGVVDKAGRRWKTSTYSKMVTRTKVRDSYLEGIKSESKKMSIDLAVISKHQADDECRYWEGMVISLNGDTAGYVTLQEAKGTGQIWHPNCLHYVSPIRDLNQLRDSERVVHEEKMKELNLK